MVSRLATGPSAPSEGVSAPVGYPGGRVGSGYLRTRVRRKTSTKTLWELCTMIPIRALR